MDHSLASLTPAATLGQIASIDQQAGQLPCKLEVMFYKKLFNNQAERTTHIAEGDFSCTYDIPANKSQP